MRAARLVDLPVWWRCLKAGCRTTGAGLDGATRHERARKHRTETTASREEFARWQKEAEER